MLTQAEINAIAEAVVQKLQANSAPEISNEIAMCRMRGIDPAEYLRSKAKSTQRRSKNASRG